MEAAMRPGDVNSPPVRLVLTTGTVEPGGALQGVIQLRDRALGASMEDIFVELVAYDDGRQHVGTFRRFPIARPRRRPDAGSAMQFKVAVPWETPVTQLAGRALPVTVGTRGAVTVSSVRDRGPLLSLTVRPLPVQEGVAEGFNTVGFTLTTARVVHGQIGGTAQRLPFRQEFRLAPPDHYRHAVRELSLTFFTHAGGADVVLDADRPTGSYVSGALTQFTIRHEDAAQRAWADEAERWLHQLIARRGTRTIPMPQGPVRVSSATPRNRLADEEGRHTDTPSCGPP